MSRQGLQSIANVADKLLKPVFKKHGFTETRIVSDWEKIVGDKLARGCYPLKITFPRNKQENGTLHIAVHSAMALMLQHVQPLILEKIATYFGYAAISRIQFHHTLMPIAAATPPAPPSYCLSESETELLETTVAAVEDDELSQALRRWGEGVLGWNGRKG